MYLGIGYYADKGLLRNAFPLSADGIHKPLLFSKGGVGVGLSI